jgi:hypothetical protein
VTGTLPTANGGTNLTSFTSGGVVYASSSSALATGSALTFDGTNLGLGANITASSSGAPSLTVGTGSGSPAITLYSSTTLQSQISFADATTGSGAYDGYLLYDQNSQYMAFGTAASEKMRLTSSSLYTASGINVGIGLSNPSSYGTRLAVSGAANVYGDERKVVSVIDTTALAAGVGAGISFFGVSESGGGVSQFGSIKGIKENATSANYAGALGFVTSNSSNVQTQRMLLDSSGNLGLGVTPSAWGRGKAYEVGTNGTAIWGDSSNGNAVFSCNAYLSTANITTGWVYGISDAASRYSQGGGTHNWYNAASGTAGNPISFTQRMTLDTDGNLLVGGTTSPSGKAGNFVNLAGGGGFWTKSGGVGYFGTLDNYAMILATNDTERARIDSDGFMYLRTTTRRSTSVFSLDSTTGTTNGMGLNASGTASSGMIVFSNPNGAVGSIDINGSATTYSTSSDYRLKNTIAPMTGALAKVAQLKPVTYKWNCDGSDGEGFIAHELAEVVPHAVTGEKDAVDADGNPKYQGIDVSFLVATLTAAIQELKAEFDAYKASHP